MKGVRTIFRAVHNWPNDSALWVDQDSGGGLAGVLCVCLPYLTCRGRTLATGGAYAAMDATIGAGILRRDFRTITRVVVDPRFRGCGVAVMMVKAALAAAETRFTESVAMMGRAVPFFDRGGMERYVVPFSAADERAIAALGAVGLTVEGLAGCDDLGSLVDHLGEVRRGMVHSELERWIGSKIQRGKLMDDRSRLVWLLGSARKGLIVAPTYFIYDRSLKCR